MLILKWWAIMKKNEHTYYYFGAYRKQSLSLYGSDAHINSNTACRIIISDIQLNWLENTLNKYCGTHTVGAILSMRDTI